MVQFKWSQSSTTFKESYQRLISAGIERICGNVTQGQQLNPLVAQLKSRLLNDMALIERVFVWFIFLGDPEETDRSRALDASRKNLEAKKYLVERFTEPRLLNRAQTIMIAVNRNVVCGHDREP
jgi:hypothetical protein